VSCLVLHCVLLAVSLPPCKYLKGSVLCVLFAVSLAVSLAVPRAVSYLRRLAPEACRGRLLGGQGGCWAAKEACPRSVSREAVGRPRRLSREAVRGAVRGLVRGAWAAAGGVWRAARGCSPSLAPFRFVPGSSFGSRRSLRSARRSLRRLLRLCPRASPPFPPRPRLLAARCSLSFRAAPASIPSSPARSRSLGCGWSLGRCSAPLFAARLPVSLRSSSSVSWCLRAPSSSLAPPFAPSLRSARVSPLAPRPALRSTPLVQARNCAQPAPRPAPLVLNILKSKGCFCTFAPLPLCPLVPFAYLCPRVAPMAAPQAQPWRASRQASEHLPARCLPPGAAQERASRQASEQVNPPQT
jgi:hypothetical protein